MKGGKQVLDEEEEEEEENEQEEEVAQRFRQCEDHPTNPPWIQHRLVPSKTQWPSRGEVECVSSPSRGPHNHQYAPRRLHSGRLGVRRNLS